jgi:tetratricopeptide (TPR) repeat protein
MNPALVEMLHAALTNHKDGNHSTALMQYRIILKHFGDSSLAWECYSALLCDLKRFEDCIEACRHALEIDHASKSARTTLKRALRGLLVEAIQSGNLGNISALADQLMEYLDDDPSGQAFEVCNIKLLLGEFETGWRLFEERLEYPNFLGAKYLLRYPKWDGKPYHGKTLLLHGEQGFGDSIMMMRYLEMAKSLGGTLILFAPKELSSLAAACPGPDLVVGEASENVSFNFQLPLMSLPYIFSTNLDTIPNKVPYITLPNHIPNKDGIDAKLASSGLSKKIGLVWAGRPSFKRDSERSIPPHILRPLEAAPNASWFCLQRDAPEIVPFPGATPLGNLFDTFVDTAYAVSQMDAVVTVDTAIAHLAGAMGVHVKLMVTCFPDWRWLLWRSDSPWYPTLKIYRQPSPGDWQSVIQQVLADLVAEN